MRACNQTLVTFCDTLESIAALPLEHLRLFPALADLCWISLSKLSFQEYTTRLSIFARLSMGLGDDRRKRALKKKKKRYAQIYIFLLIDSWYLDIESRKQPDTCTVPKPILRKPLRICCQWQLRPQRLLSYVDVSAVAYDYQVLSIG